MFRLQYIQDVNMLVYFLALLAWCIVAWRVPRYRGYSLAPIFYSLIVVGYYLLDFIFNPEIPGSVTIFTFTSALIRLVGGFLLLGIATIVLIDQEQQRGEV